MQFRDRVIRSRATTTSRRGFLAGTGAAVLAGVAGSAGLADAAHATETRIELDARASGWVGRSPAAIEGTTNPTLTLSAGHTYTVAWTNRDGLQHNFVVVDAQGTRLVDTARTSDVDGTQTLHFTATAEISEYFCEVHPGSMRGDVVVEGADDPFVPAGPTVELETVAEGLVSPLGFEVAEEPRDRRFVVDQVGLIHVHGPDGLEPDPFLDVLDRLVALREGFDERGLLGLAFHPDFATNRRLYVRYSAPPREGTPDGDDHTFVLSEFEATADLSAGDPDSERTLLEIPEPQFNHNAGALAFGPDGYLYVGVGDGGNANDVGDGHVADWYVDNDGGNGQDVTENLLGSVLRIDVDGSTDGKPYGVPPDNPLVGETGLDEQYAWGFRNPWRFSFDGQGRLFVADVGQDRIEEVNLVERGGNYGWNVKEGAGCFSAAAPGEPPALCPERTPTGTRGGELLEDPIIQYPHRARGEQVGLSVVGGFVYEGSDVPDLHDGYVFGDWSRSFGTPDGRLFVATPSESDERWGMAELAVAGAGGGLGRFVLSLGRDRDGELYVLTSERAGPTGNTGAVHRIAAPLFDGPIPGTGGNAPPSDPNGDGRYEDVTGDGTATFGDAIALAFADFGAINGTFTAEQIAALDFDGDGRVGFGDAISLAFRV